MVRLKKKSVGTKSSLLRSTSSTSASINLLIYQNVETDIHVQKLLVNSYG